MSDSMNPAGPTGQNPLASGPQNIGAPSMGSHAQVGQMMATQNFTPKEMVKQADAALYGANEYAKMAKNPDLKAKDVVKAAAQAVADGKTDAEGAIKLLTSMPTDPKHLHAWAKNLYAVNLAAAVHLKASLIQQGIPFLPQKKKTKA